MIRDFRSADDFRQAISGWLQENLPPGVLGPVPDGFDGVWGGRRFVYPSEDHRLWLTRAAAVGLTAPTWPLDCGGAGLSRDQARIFDQELARLRAPLPLIGLGLAIVGPTFLAHGSPQQKRVHLRRICQGETRWCQGFSEPGAGSDLASLRTRAVRDGDAFVVNGQKIWTSYAHLSDWIFALVRTDVAAPKHDGISVLLIDLSSPGVTIRPIPLISGDSHFCEVFFDDVRVPADQMLGEANKGWEVAKTLLGFERKVVSESMGPRSLLGGVQKRKSARERTAGVSALGALARRHLPQTDGRLHDEQVRQEIARVEMAARSLELATRSATELLRAGQTPGAEAAILKVVGTELNQSRAALRLALAGPAALAWPTAGDDPDDDDADVAGRWLRSRANTIEGGTTEMQLNGIARRILNLTSD